MHSGGSRASCDECAAIAQELSEAYEDAWRSGDETFRDGWVATYKMIGGTEDDVAQAEALLPTTQLRKDPLRINHVIERKFVHEARSGHKIQAFGLRP
jgi:hypothetical protein